MASEYKKYTIEKGDCLSLLAQKFNVTLDELKELNSEQIKNIDLIYTGKEINVPGGSPNQPIKDGATTDLPSPPSDCASGNDLCKTSPEYVDILYVPAHPKTGKKCYYAITKAAQTAILQEQKTLVSAIHPNDSEKTLQDLNDLGVFANFYTSPHGRFLDIKDRDRYDYLVIALKTILSGAYQTKDGFLENLSEQELSKEDFAFLYHEQLEKYELQIELTNNPSYWGIAYGGSSAIEHVKKTAKLEKNKEKARQKIKDKLINDLERKIKSFEDKAQKNAARIETDDGSYYVYDNDRKYYTSNTEKEIESLFKYIIKSKIDNKIYFESFTDDAISLSSHREADRKINNFNNLMFSSLPDNRDKDFKEKLKSLNTHGFVIKEQCLTYDELEGSNDDLRGPKTFRQEFDDWRAEGAKGSGLPIEITEAESLIDKLFNDISVDFSKISKRDLSGRITLTDEDALDRMLKETGADKWAYYPSIALIKVIDSTFIKWNSDIKSLLEGNSNRDVNNAKFPLPKIFSGLLWVKKIAQERINRIKKLAEERANKNQNIKFLKDFTEPKSSFVVIWDDSNYIAKKKQTSEIKKGNDFIRVIECVLMSVGTLGWVRGPSWYLPETYSDLSSAKGHVKEITKNVSVVSHLSGNSSLKGKQALTNLTSAMDVIKSDFSSTALKSMKENVIGGKFLLNPYNLTNKKEIVDSAFWSNNYHWEDGLGPNKIDSQYVVDASAQLLRFTASSQENLNVPLSKFKSFEPNSNTEFSGQMNMSFDLFHSQMRFDAWYPIQKYREDNTESKGQEFSIYYNTTESNKPEKYSLGYFFFHLSAVIYATAAASIAVSKNIQFGFADTADGKIGVRGIAYSESDYVSEDGTEPKFKKYERTRINVPNSTKNTNLVAADANFKVDMFAGVETGGMVEGEIYWQPPQVSFNGYEVQDNIMRLGKLSAQAAVSYGAGLSAEFRITLHNGAIYMIVAATWVTGPGASGKIAIELDYLSIDRLFKHILNVYYQNGFESLSSVGEYNSTLVNKNTPQLKDLNNLLTSALFLGLSVGEVLLLPVKFLDHMTYENLKEDYGPMLASNIIDKENQKSTQMWVQQLSPEVLAKLLDCLSDVDDLTALTIENAKQLVEKLEAIVKVLGWIKDKSGQDEINTYQQYEITMSLIGGDGEFSNVTYIRWFNIYVGWRKISRVVSKIIKNRNHVNNLLNSGYKFNIKNAENNLFEIQDYLLSMEVKRNLENYNNYCRLLSKNISIYYRDDADFKDFLLKDLYFDELIDFNEIIVIKISSSSDSENVIKDRNYLLNKIESENWSKKDWIV